jgi:hypothetical protein
MPFRSVLPRHTSPRAPRIGSASQPGTAEAGQHHPIYFDGQYLELLVLRDGAALGFDLGLLVVHLSEGGIGSWHDR